MNGRLLKFLIHLALLNLIFLQPQAYVIGMNFAVFSNFIYMTNYTFEIFILEYDLKYFPLFSLLKTF